MMIRDILQGAAIIGALEAFFAAVYFVTIAVS
jgi:hypothetical protein